MRRQVAVALATLLVLPTLAGGQTPIAGDRVRFTHPGEGTRTGTLVAITPDTLEVLIAGRTGAARLPLDQVTRLDVSRGKGRHLKRAAVGLFVGAGVGALGGYASGTNDCSTQELICIDRGGSALLGGAALGVLGGIGGLIAGVVPTEKWERVSLERRRLSFVAPATGHGRGVGLRYAF
jgi:hypothetical protein